MRALRAGLALAGLAFVSLAAVQTPPPVYTPGDEGISAPKVVSEVRPRYTKEAQDARIQGALTVECLVLPDGSVSDARVTRSLDRGLDEEALKAIRQWRFDPGRKGAAPVPVKVSVEFTFALKGPGAAGALFPAPVRSGDAGTTRAGAAVYKVGGDVSAPRILKEVKARYEESARQETIQGVVTLDCVVLSDGRVGDVQISRSLDPRLDDEAVTALKQWTFKPGRKDGKPVPVLVSVDMTFALK